MDKKLLTKKIQALLHDPPEKPIILGKVGHEGRAKEIIAEIITEGKIPEDIRTADHVASAADRINLPKDERFVADFCKNPVIKHPLSGKEFTLGTLAQVDPKDITAAVDRSFVYLENKYKGDTEKIYLALWRELVDLLIIDHFGAVQLGQLWELLPADTRIPDHSIWEHKRITSAIVGALPKPAFLLFSIGPVQEFIATARKTQDLWAGSYLLSYLSWSAMKVVAEEFGPDSLIFPDLFRQPFVDSWLIDKGLEIDKFKNEEISSPTLPNRFFAIVPADAVRGIAEKAKLCVKETFLSACNAVKKKIAEDCGIQLTTDWDDIWHRQTFDFVDAYWVATAIEEVKDLSNFIREYKRLMGIMNKWNFENLLEAYKTGFYPNIGTVYGQIYRLTEKTLGSRKALRDFEQKLEPNHKCTLCGVREPVHPGDHNGRSCKEEFGALKGFWQERVLPKFPQIRRSERLCAVCATKRLSSKYFFREHLGYKIVDNFPSLSMVATSAFKLRVIENIGHNGLAIMVDQFVKAVQSLVGERWSGVPMPMVLRACRNQISRDFAYLEGDWLYKEAFDNEEALWEESNGRFSKDEFKQLLDFAKIRQRELFEFIKDFDKGKDKNQKIGSPSTYYAVLLMDGDNMGIWLSGGMAPKIEEILHPDVINNLNKQEWKECLNMHRPLNPSLHLATSRALRDFSLHVAREVVEKDHLGKLVYAGGDDVLAFVCLRDLPEVMRKLRAYFSGSLTKISNDTVEIDFQGGSGFIPIDRDGEPINIESRRPILGFKLSMGPKATASMGVVIAHHSSNLSQVLEEVRYCEKEAKKLESKNAFCISLAKRAGEKSYLTAKWYYDDQSAQKGVFETIPLLRRWIDAFYNDYISPQMVYTVLGESGGLEGLPSEAIEFELLRITDRHRNKTSAEFNRDQMIELVSGLVKLYNVGLSLEKIGIFLSVAAFFGREGNR